MEQHEYKIEHTGLGIVGQQVEPSITFHPGDPMKEVMRIDRHGVRVNPEYSVDEATQHVLNALTAHIQHTVSHAVEAERRAMMQLFTDPENQPTQHGTVTVEYMQREIAAKLDAVADKVKTDFSAAFGADTCESWAVWIRSQK